MANKLTGPSQFIQSNSSGTHRSSAAETRAMCSFNRRTTSSCPFPLATSKAVDPMVIHPVITEQRSHNLLVAPSESHATERAVLSNSYVGRFTSISLCWSNSLTTCIGLAQKTVSRIGINESVFTCSPFRRQRCEAALLETTTKDGIHDVIGTGVGGKERFTWRGGRHQFFSSLSTSFRLDPSHHPP